MKVKYDAKVDAIYFDLAEGKYKRTRKITDAILVDEDADGKILGIEILDAKENIKAFDPQKTQISITTT